MSKEAFSRIMMNTGNLMMTTVDLGENAAQHPGDSVKIDTKKPRLKVNKGVSV